jgi:hypothetical protein
VVNLVWLSLASALHTLEDFKAVLDHSIRLIEVGAHYSGSAPDWQRLRTRFLGDLSQ